jgi:diphthamide synthase subunit DPH2
MLEILKELQKGTILEFSNEDIIDFIESDQIGVSNVSVIQSDDDMELIIVEMDYFYLIAHNFDTDPRYYLYQMLDSGDIEDLEQNGYLFLNDDSDFRSKIVNREEGKAHVYKHSEIGAVYDLIGNDEEEETSVAICEYISSSHHLSHMLVLMANEETLKVFQGFEISEEDIIFSEDVE